MDLEPLTLSLRHPDLLLRPSDPGFSTPVAEELLSAFAEVKAADDNTDILRPRYERLRRLLRRRMSRGERLLTYYLLAQCAAAWDIPAALICNDRALLYAKADRERGAMADLLYMRGLLFRRSSELRAAALEYDQILWLILEHGAEPGTEAGQLHLDTLIGLAHFHLWLENFDLANDYIERAAALSRRTSTNELTHVTILWIQAVIERYQNRPYAALRHAIAAAEVYVASRRNTRSTVRVLALTAELALDMAALFPSEPGARATFVCMAREYAVFGERLARRARDASGRGLSALARARAALASRRSGRGRALIQAVIGLATREEDWALRSQAWTALGFDLRDGGDRAGAKAAFEAALADLDLAHAPALGILPRQALRDL